MNFEKLTTHYVPMENKTMHCVRSKTGKPSLWTLLKFKKDNENFNRITEIINSNMEVSDSVIYKDEKRSKLLKTIDLENNKYVLKIFLDDVGYKVSFFEISNISAYENKIELIPIFRIEFNDSILKYNENLEKNTPETQISKLQPVIENLISIFKNQ